MIDHAEWVKVNRHLQSIGTATCDVSQLILLADDFKLEGNDRAAFRMMTAARDVLRHRKSLRLHLAAKQNAKRKIGKYKP